MINREQLRKMIPKGYCKEIAKSADVTQSSVSLYFSGKINSEKIETAALEVAATLSKSKRRLLRTIYSAVNNN